MMMLRARRWLILPATVAFVLLFIISAHVFSAPDNWSQWSSVNNKKTANIPHDPQEQAVIHPPMPIKASTTSVIPIATPTPEGAVNSEEGDGDDGEVICPPREPSLLELSSQAKPIKSLNITFDVPNDIKYDPAGPKPEQVVILTAADRGGHHGTIKDMHERVADNRKAYCDYHGYKYHFVDISEFELPDADTVWKKIPAIVKTFNAFPEAQWILILDLDIIIMTPELDLNSLILSGDAMQKNLLFSHEMVGSNRSHTGSYTNPTFDWKNMDFIISQDHNGINAGAFFVRRSHFSQLLMDMWVDPFFLRNKWGGPEQDAMRHLVRHHPVVRNHFGLMRQRVVNSFYEGDDTMAFEEGDLLVHFAGCWVSNQCAERFEEMWERRKIAQIPSVVAAPGSA